MSGSGIEEAVGEPFATASVDELRALLAARDKTIAVLTRRVQRAQSGEDSGFELFRASAFLQKQLEHQDKELSLLRQRLATEVKAHQDEVGHRARLERSLEEAGRVEALGRLAGGIAHEINTPTQYVGDNLRFLQDCLVQLAPVMKWLAAAREGGSDGVAAAPPECPDAAYLAAEMPAAIRQSLEGIEHIAGIVRSMKELCHPGGKTKSPVDVNRALQTAVNVARSEWKYRAEMHLALDAQLPHVPGFAAELGQVFLNLLVNAAHAIEDRRGRTGGGIGNIRLRTRAEGQWVAVEIEDDGCGMPPEVQKRIFEPFFTTKAVGRGTGQGLALAHSVVHQKHGGRIEVDSAVGKGTTFRVRLPIHDEGHDEAHEGARDGTQTGAPAKD